MIGKTISHYEILAKLGEGGMGVVYRARDIRLRRDVALKFLGDRVGDTPEFIKRFEREARLLAALNHPGIAAVHDIGEHEGRPYMALELVEGEDLAARLKRGGALPPEQAIDLMQSVARALAAAHAHGVVHRDLKPANLMLTAEGGVKILDFGLARTVRRETTGGETGNTTTVLSEITDKGQLMGTAGYMSPEQARGEPVDARTDVWSFGCILYECLTGERAFTGRSLSDYVAAVLMAEPEWARLPKNLSPDVGRVLRRCLRKDADRRYHATADVEIDLADAVDDEAEEAPTPALQPGRARAIPWLIGAALLVAGIAGGWLLANRTGPGTPASTEMRRFTVEPAPDTRIALAKGNPIALSRDGSMLVYVGWHEYERWLYLRDLRRLEARRLEGTADAAQPVFSPDGRWLAFFAHGKLKRIAVDGSTVQELCDAPASWGADWGTSGTIIFAAQTPTRLFSISEGGGWLREIETAPADPVNATHHWPQFLPDDQFVLTSLWTGFGYEDHDVAVVNLATGEHHGLIENAAYPVADAAGNVLFMRGNSLFVASIDLDTHEVTAPPSIVSKGVRSWDTSHAFYDLADDGTLAMASGQGVEAFWLEKRQFVRVDRTGAVTPLDIPPGPYTFPNLSPDGRRLALTVFKENSIENWIWEFDRGNFARLTSDRNEHIPIWSPDGSRLAISCSESGSPNVYVMDARPGATPTRLTESTNHQDPASWSPDGRYLTVVDMLGAGQYDIHLVSLDDDGGGGGSHGQRVTPLVVSGGYESHAMIAPGGASFAYTSNRSGQREIYVEPFPDGGTPVQVSVDGGTDPMWARDGSELYYWTWSRDSDPESIEPQQLMVVVIGGGDESRRGPADRGDRAFEASAPRRLFRTSWVYHAAGRPNYDVTRDGEFILLQKPRGEIGMVQVVVGWGARKESL